MQTRVNQPTEEEEYVVGSKVCIVGGVYQRRGYKGLIAGSTRCYVDVYVSQLGKQLRVRKTSVRVEAELKSTGRPAMNAGVPLAGTGVATVLAAQRIVAQLLLELGTSVAHLGVPVGDAGLHAASDVAMMLAYDLQQEGQQESKKCECES
jgi:hypothetical protein